MAAETTATARLDVPEEILDAARMSIEELKIELAVALYARRRLSLGKSRELAGLSLWEFRQLAASRGVHADFDETDLSDDIQTLRESKSQ